MRQRLGPEAPPIYQWDMSEALAFIAACLMVALMLLGCLLFMPGFDDLVLFLIGIYCARYYWPQIIPRYKLWQKTRDELRIFREEIEEHDSTNHTD